MPLGTKPTCGSCKISNSTLWRKGVQGDVMCNTCFIKQSGNGGGKEAGSNGNGTSLGKNNGGSSLIGGPVLRKSSRIRPSKSKFQAATKALATKGKSRRIIFKKSQPIKAPTAVATVVTGDSVYHNGMYFQVGDIVSLVDHDSSVYYAQIRGFMQDQYNEKSAVITWMIPTLSSPRDRFDPCTYTLGPEEDLPRKLEFMEFVCHAPSDYYKAKNAPYHSLNSQPDLCYIWTNIGPQVQPTPSIDEVFGLKKTQNSATSKVDSKDRERLDKHDKQKDKETDKHEKPIKVEKDV
ncbi:GATA zinc finger domain-containing protein 1-like [Haliotis rubra]|uniref:GATA zinc finger domain-containing protein 1-like n=1 Tax=Haliotis rubra TaxID=36100 RepID=UPI001EE548AE|nr:GATA zinc finger domain-containing protein 1-like [Haliotis rubra]